MPNFVFVLNPDKQPLSAIHPAKARLLLKEKKAAVFRRYPFTIIFKEEVRQTAEPIKIKLDPGSQTTGIALVQSNQVILGAELTHRGQVISKNLTSRRQFG